MDTLTLDQIQYLTGHETTDAVRMALKRAGVKANGVGFGPSWPPKKLYPADEVWEVFGARILEHATTDADVKERCWSVFRKQIGVSANGVRAIEVFGDRLAR